MPPQSSITTPAADAASSPTTEGRGSWKSFSASAVGIEMGLCVLFGWGAGTWLDGKLGSEPYVMLAGLLMGVVAGFRALLRSSRLAWDRGSEPGPRSSRTSR